MIVKCEWCGKDFKTYEHRRREGRGKYCSSQCAYAARRIDKTARFWNYVDKSAGPDACWPWTRACTPSGYGHYEMLGRQDACHRFAYELTHGALPKGAYILHSCDNPPCCNPAHLSLGTALDNMRDALSRGHRNNLPKGEHHCHHKLTANQVKEIRSLRASGIAGSDLAAQYGVSQSTICDIIMRRTWDHL